MKVRSEEQQIVVVTNGANFYSENSAILIL